MSSKLIRLTTDDPNCIFDAQFDNDIVLEPNSEIAVQSCTFKTGEIIEITAADNALSATVGGSQHTVYLTRETYSKKNIRDLLLDMQNKLNRTLRLGNSKEFGLQYQVRVNHEDKVTIQALQDPLPTQPMHSLSSVLTADANQAEYFNVVPPNAINSIIGGQNDPNPVVISINHATAYGINPWTKGCGVHRFRINNMETGAQNGLCMGLTKNIAALRNQTLTQADLECAIQITDKTTQYEVKQSSAGAFAASGVTLNQAVDSGPGPVGNDVLEVAMEAGVIRLRVHTNAAGGTTHELGQYVYDYTTNPDLFPFICFFRDTDEITVDLCNHSLDPYVHPQATASGTTHAHPGLSVINFPDTATNVAFVLNTNNDNLADILGFPNRILYSFVGGEVSVVGSSKTYTIVAANNYLIEMLNFPIESYDSFEDYSNAGSKRGRANIIACIPINDSSGASSLGIIQYEPNTPHFISLANKDQRLMRNIRARIVNDDYTSVESFGMATITLLLKNK